MKHLIVLCAALLLVSAMAFADGGNGGNKTPKEKGAATATQGAAGN